jgi:hypothetical protein
MDRLKKIRKDRGLEQMKKKLGYSLSDSDLRRVCGQDLKIVEYKDLNQFENMYDLLPKEKDCVVILVESKPSSGHWTCILRNNHSFQLFDSYGSKIQDELNFISKAMNRMLGQTKGELDKLIDSVDDNHEVIYNKDRLQSENPDVATCGRWTALVVNMFKMGYSLPEILEVIENQVKETGMSPDILVCKWIPI